MLIVIPKDGADGLEALLGDVEPPPHIAVAAHMPVTARMVTAAAIRGGWLSEPGDRWIKPVVGS